MRPEYQPPQRTELLVSTRTVLRVMALTTGFLAFLYLLFLVRGVLTSVLIAVFLAIALNPAVNGLQRRFGLGHTPAALIVFLGTLLALIGFLTAVVTPLYDDVLSFAADLPDRVRNLENLPFLETRPELVERLERQANRLPEALPASAGALLGVASTVFHAVFTTVTVLFLTLFLLLELPAIGRNVLSLMPPATAERAARLQAEINVTVSRYVAGILFIAFCAGTSTFGVLLILDVQFALVLALLMSFFVFIPLIGATIGGSIVVLAAFTQGLTAGLVMLGFVIVYQQVENHLLQPLVMRKSVDVSPFIVIVSVLIGTSLLGILGALLAIPAAGSIQIVLREVLEARRARMEEQREALRVQDAEAGPTDSTHGYVTTEAP